MATRTSTTVGEPHGQPVCRRCVEWVFMPGYDYETTSRVYRYDAVSASVRRAISWWRVRVPEPPFTGLRHGCECLIRIELTCGERRLVMW